MRLFLDAMAVMMAAVVPGCDADDSLNLSAHGNVGGTCSYRCRIEGEHPTGACIDVGGEGEWDRLFVGWPVVVNHKEEEFRMYYHSLDLDTKKFTIGASALLPPPPPLPSPLT